MYNRFLQHSNLQDHTYQRQGVQWCLAKEVNAKELNAKELKTKELDLDAKELDLDIKELSIKGAILADEMGLGKTITMLATIALHINKKNQRV